ncbi:MAG: hypothetical protein ABSC08_17405, partial [Bryobacteraceae bacterium]
ACLLDGLAEQLQAQGNEVVGWFVSRISGERAPTDSDADLHRHFFSTPDSLLLVLHPRREGDVWTEVHVYHSESQKLAPCDPIWVIDPAPLPAVDRKAGPPSARDRQGHPRASSDDQRQSADGAILAVAPLSRTAARPPSDTGEPGGSSAAARRSQHGSIWDSIPNDVWRLLALSIVLVIGCAAWLWLFQADVVRPLLLRWTSSASAPPSTISLTAKLDRDHMTVQWDGGSPVFLNPMSVQLIFEFVGAGPTTVPLRPDEAQRGYFATLTSLPPSRVTMIVIPAPGSQFTETFPFPAPEHGQHEAVGAAPVPGLPNPSPIK